MIIWIGSGGVMISHMFQQVWVLVKLDEFEMIRWYLSLKYKVLKQYMRLRVGKWGMINKLLAWINKANRCITYLGFLTSLTGKVGAPPTKTCLEILSDPRLPIIYLKIFGQLKWRKKKKIGQPRHNKLMRSIMAQVKRLSRCITYLVNSGQKLRRKST